jgi:bacterioferritin (cytochrome b1)
LATSAIQPASLTTCRAREEGQYNFLETKLDLLERIGLQNCGLLQAEAAGSKEK